ncbi:MAG: ArsR/SmtB family transcription factor [Gemmatimonadaceae bacterium]
MPQSLVHAVVTPRFEIFYALQALESGAGEHLHEWRREMERRLPARLRTSLASVAPTPLMWPLIADALREAPTAITFNGMVESLSTMDAGTFQAFVLGGVFKAPGAVESLVSERASLARTVTNEVATQEKLLTLLGLHPFSRQSPATAAFDKLVTSPGSYRAEVVNVLASFWAHGFSDTWQRLEREMKERAQEMRASANRRSFAVFAKENKLPLTMEGKIVMKMRGSTAEPVKSTEGVYLIPSAFNVARLWAAYDSKGRTKFFLPVLDTRLQTVGATVIDPAAIFRALGDTTRYAIATSIARTPMTSVELARAFDVSKPTISHHVQLLRAAGLLDESQTEAGVVLALNRRILERASTAAAREMFTEEEAAEPVIRRTRRANKQ